MYNGYITFVVFIVFRNSEEPGDHRPPKTVSVRIQLKYFELFSYSLLQKLL